MAEHIQTTRMRRLPTVFGVWTTFSDEILDVKRFAQVNWWKSLTLEGKCLRWRAKPAHLEGHLPAGEWHKSWQSDEGKDNSWLCCEGGDTGILWKP